MVHLEGFSKVTRSALQIKDRSIMPPDRVIFNYLVFNEPTETVVEVTGNWGDYLRDVDAGLVVKKHAPLNDTENPENATLITDFYPEGIPDRAYIPDPTLPL